MLDASLTSLTRLGGLAVDASAVTEEVRASRPLTHPRVRRNRRYRRLSSLCSALLGLC